MENSCLIASYILPKRTRKNVKQSKNGCYTCKARRIKCDETRPQCLRCQRAHKKCLGYAPNDHSPSSTDTESSDMSSFQVQGLFDSHVKLNTLSISLEDSHLANLGLELLFQGRYETTSWGLSAGWLQLLTQSFATSDAMLKCLLFLGSACETLFLPETPQQHLPLILRHQSAIISLQKEVSTLEDGPLPVFLASIILAVASVLLQRLNMALTHVQGTFKSLALLIGKDEQHSTKPSSRSFEGFTENLKSIALSLDMHTGWYRLSRPPDLPRSIKMVGELPDIRTMSNLEVATLLHDCYHFAAAADKFKYRPRTEVPQDLIREQNYLIAVLNRIIAQTVNPETVCPRQLEAHEAVTSSMTQAVQCLSTLIYISMVLHPYECAYDQFQGRFSQIVDISESLLSRGYRNANRSGLPRFQLQPGLFQPLYFTAIKCRTTAIRYQAVHNLEKLGLEGPWNPQIMSAVARRIISIEEKRDLIVDTDRQRDVVVVAEQDRIHGCGLNNPPFDECKFPVIVQIELSRCKDIEALIKLSESEQEQNWELWREQIEIASYV